MKEETRKRLSKLILEELADKIKVNESLGRKLEAFVDLPVEKVADAIIKQFEYLLSSDLRDLIFYLIEKEAKEEQSVKESQPVEINVADKKEREDSKWIPLEKLADDDVLSRKEVVEKPVTAEIYKETSDSVLEYFGTKETLATEPIEFQLTSDDWLYIYGFSYSPDSAGKGIPTHQIKLKGVDKKNNIFLLDYGDVRFYLSKINADDYPRNKFGEPTLSSKDTNSYKYEFSYIMNTLRVNEVVVPLPFWTIQRGREKILQNIEDRYVELLRALIDVHDAVEWDLEVFVLDNHIANLPSIKEMKIERTPQREGKHSVGKKADVKLIERVIFKEKSLAQEIHSELLPYAHRAKIDYIIRLDSAFIDEWKSILSARYELGKDKRKAFNKKIAQIQNKYKEYQLMLNLTSPSVSFTFVK